MLDLIKGILLICMCDPQLCLKRNSLALILFNFHVTAIGGSLFLFDRKVLRYFRKDGHNWRKKKDGKTVKEAHEKLKVSNWLTEQCTNEVYPSFLYLHNLSIKI